jgi:hypothetical protein
MLSATETVVTLIVVTVMDLSSLSAVFLRPGIWLIDEETALRRQIAGRALCSKVFVTRPSEKLRVHLYL